MDRVNIVESGVTFGAFKQDNVFLIEKVLTDLDYGDGINKVEFILKHKTGTSSVIFLEAKSSIPKESDGFFEEIRRKMIHSLTLWVSTICGRHSSLKNSLAKNLKSKEDLLLPIKLILVIPKLPDELLEQISQKFKKSLEIERKIWDINYSHIMVLNESRARKYKLIGANI
ncbi:MULTISPECIES: hypothetical protein [unclassified Sulfurospirillum]|uniref:hypothetical protein n=1 Tax=unclassified Sulfurospirillum TaxID=2618290 RepID=UPI000503BCE7|nr:MULTISPECIES: hypothetical protein [unclassified Sulfurospirillum]KFL34034.1 hypothetical protein JU57_07930 [Sulfurospirillum sp. SCADC]